MELLNPLFKRNNMALLGKALQNWSKGEVVEQKYYLDHTLSHFRMLEQWKYLKIWRHFVYRTIQPSCKWFVCCSVGAMWLGSHLQGKDWSEGQCLVPKHLTDNLKALVKSVETMWIWSWSGKGQAPESMRPFPVWPLPTVSAHLSLATCCPLPVLSTFIIAVATQNSHLSPNVPFLPHPMS